MIVCSCNVLSDGEVRACMGPGPGCPRTAAEVYQCLGCSPKCGKCARTIRAIIGEALQGAAGQVSAHRECATGCRSGCSHGSIVGEAGVGADVTLVSHILEQVS